MKMVFPVLCLGATLAAAEKLPEPVAWLGKMPLESARFARLEPPVRSADRKEMLTKAVQTEAYVVIINRLLAMSRIAPDAKTAERYIAFRKIQAGPDWNPVFEKKLRALAKQPEFQLKAALFFTMFAAEPAAVEPAAAEIEQFFYQNRDRFKIPEQRSYSLFLAGTREKGEAAKALLHQGVNFAEVAKKFDPSGARDRIPGELLFELNRLGSTMKAGEWREVHKEGKTGFVLLKAVTPEKMISFAEAAPLIREEISGLKLKNALELYIQAELRKHPLKMNF